MTKLSFQHRSQCGGFTLLEVVIVLAIVALLLSVIYSIAQGTLTLADDIRRAQRRDSRHQAFTAFCGHLFADLPASAIMRMHTTQAAGQYLPRIDLEQVRSPFDGSPNQCITLLTEAKPGGGLRLLLACRKQPDAEPSVSVVLFDDLEHCEWRAFNRLSQQWTTAWDEPSGAEVTRTHPELIELSMTQPDGRRRHVFWVVPSAMLTTQVPHQPQG